MVLLFMFLLLPGTYRRILQMTIAAVTSGRLTKNNLFQNYNFIIILRISQILRVFLGEWGGGIGASWGIA